MPVFHAPEFLQSCDCCLCRFNATQLSAMSIEHEQTNVAWYSRFARHPYYGLTGINSGVSILQQVRIT